MQNKLRNSNLQISEKYLKHFKETCLSVLNTISCYGQIRSRQGKKILKNGCVNHKKNNKQRNKCVSLVRKTKKNILFESECEKHSRE